MATTPSTATSGNDTATASLPGAYASVADVWADIRSRTDALLEVLDGAPAGSDGRPVPGTDWTAGETAAHLANLFARMVRDFRRSATAEETAALNQACLEEFGEATLAHAAAAIRADLAVAEEVVPTYPAGLVVPFHAGIQASVVDALAVVVGELSVHGWEIAEAVGAPWDLDEEALSSMARSLLAILPGWVRAGAGPLAVAVVLDDGGPPITVRAADGRASVAAHDAAGAEATAPLSPSTFLLGLLGRRRSGERLVDDVLVGAFGPF